MRDLEKTMKALANRRRLGIVKLLKKDGAVSVADIAREIGLSFKATSKHLGILYAAGILERDQQRLTINYRIAPALHKATKHVLTTL